MLECPGANGETREPSVTFGSERRGVWLSRLCLGAAPSPNPIAIPALAYTERVTTLSCGHIWATHVTPHTHQPHTEPRTGVEHSRRREGSGAKGRLGESKRRDLGCTTVVVRRPRAREGPQMETSGPLPPCPLASSSRPLTRAASPFELMLGRQRQQTPPRRKLVRRWLPRHRATRWRRPRCWPPKCRVALVRRYAHGLASRMRTQSRRSGLRVRPSKRRRQSRRRELAV